MYTGRPQGLLVPKEIPLGFLSVLRDAGFLKGGKVLVDGRDHQVVEELRDADGVNDGVAGNVDERANTRHGADEPAEEHLVLGASGPNDGQDSG